MTPAAPREWLPDFCRVPTVFAVIVAAEIAVLVIALAPVPEHDFVRRNLIVSSLFGQWLALVTVVLLCKLRPLIHRLPVVPGALSAWCVTLGVAVFGSWLVHRLDTELGTGLSVAFESRLDFVLGTTAIVALLSAALLRYFYVQEQWKVQVRAHAQAEVRALQARIRPHFLFNSMNSIASLVRHDPATAERAIEDLSDLFRAALGAGQGESTLGEELDLAERFLAIEKLRLGERLQTVFTLEPDLPRGLAMPRLILQPLVENAVIHGVSRLAAGGTIEVTAKRAGRELQISVRNPCPPPRDAAAAGNRHAQDSIAQRLAHHFGPKAWMATDAGDGYYAVTLWIPLA